MEGNFEFRAFRLQVLGLGAEGLGFFGGGLEV